MKLGVVVLMPLAISCASRASTAEESADAGPDAAAPHEDDDDPLPSQDAIAPDAARA